MEILAAGFCRTGTMSTRKALVDLGLAPCFHMMEVIENDLLVVVNDFFRGNKQALLDYLKKNNFKATLDFPIICLIDELLPEFPDAKVLLNVRDSPETWVKSFRSTVWRIMNIPAYTKISSIIGPPFSVVGNPEFQILHDFCFQRVVERGNTVASEKLPDYSRNFTDEQYSLGSSGKRPES